MRRVERQQGAADPDTSLFVLRTRCYDESWRVRSAAASNPKLPEALLRRLAADTHPRVRKEVARHPLLPGDLLEVLATDPSSVVRDRIAVRRAVATDSDLAGSLAASPRGDLRRLAAASPATPPSSLAALALDADVGVRMAVATNAAAPERVVRALADDADEAVRVALARLPHLPHRVVDRLTRDPAPTVRVAVAGNAACSPPALRKLAKRCWREPEVLRALAGNTAAPGRLLRRLAGHRWDVACVVAANPACPPRLLRSGRLCGSHVLAVRMAVAAGAAGPPSIFARLARDNAAVRLFLATNPALSPDVVERLSADRDPYVGRVAAAHRRASPEALTGLADGMTAPAWTLRAIAANPACPPELSDQLLTWLALGGAGAVDPRFDPVTCSGHPGEPGSNLAGWYRTESANATDPLRHPLWRVRAAIPASRKSTPYIWLAEMARDIRPEVRQVASRYSGLPAAVLKELSGDAAAGIAKQAAASLKRKLEQPETKVRRRRVWTTRMVMGAILIAVLILEFRPGQRPSFPSTTTITSPNDVPSPILTEGPTIALPGGGTMVVGLLDYSGGTYLIVAAQGERLTVTIPGTAGSVPAAQNGYPVAAYSVQQFIFATPGTATRTISVAVTAADGKHATVPVQLPAGS